MFTQTIQLNGLGTGNYTVVSINDSSSCNITFNISTGATLTSTSSFILESNNISCLDYNTTLVLEDANGCQYTANLSGTIDAACNLVSTIPNDSICIGEDIVFSISGNTGTVNWTITPGNITGTTNGGNESVGGLGVNSYTISYDEGGVCFASDSFIVNELPECVFTYNGINYNSGDIITLCQDDINAGVNVSVCQGQLGNTYNWSNGDSANFSDITNPGIYSVAVTTSDGCTNTFNITIASISTSDPAYQTTCCPNFSFTLTAA